MSETALTPASQAEKALAFSDTKAKLMELASGSARIIEITNTAGYKECHAARMALKDARVSIQKIGKEARDDAVKFQKAVIAKEKELVEIIEPEERRLQGLQDAIDRQAEIEKQAKEQAERDRIAAIHARFDAVKALPLMAVNASADEIREAIEHATAIDTAFPSGDKDAEANSSALAYEVRIAIASLRAALDRREAQDAEAIRIAAEREELDRLRRESEAQQAEIERLAAAERQRAAEEERRVEAAARAEREAAEAAARKAREEEQARIDAERAEQRRKDDADRAKAERKLREDQARAAAEREALEREKAAAAKAAREAEISAATLVSAAADAVAFLESIGHADNIVTKKLASALHRKQLEEV